MNARRFTQPPSRNPTQPGFQQPDLGETSGEALKIAMLSRRVAPHILLALWTGQRLGGLLRLPWSGYDGKYFRLRQSKSGTRVGIPGGAPL